MALPAFISPLPLPARIPTRVVSRTPLPASRRVRRRPPRMTSPDVVRGQPTSDPPARDAPPSPPPSPSLPSPPPFPPHVLSNPLLLALYTIFSGGAPPAPHLLPLFHPSIVWDTPLATLSSPSGAVNFLSSLLFFVEDPVLDIHSAVRTHASLRFEWFLSVTYPLPWRPRVSVSGVSVVTFEDDLITRIDDEWYIPPRNIIAQTLPTLTDIIWLWPTPHAENDSGSRRVVRKTRGYTLLRHAPHKEVRVRSTLMPGDRNMIWAAPTLPDEVFEGGLRKQELYSTVTPVGVRKVGEDEFEWAVAVPGTLVGSSKVLVREPSADNAWTQMVEEGVWATLRFRGIANRELIDLKLTLMVDALVDDGVISGAGELKMGTVWVRSYDARVGFNSKGIFSIATYGATYGLPRLNEIAIDLTGIVNLEDK